MLLKTRRQKVGRKSEQGENGKEGGQREKQGLGSQRLGLSFLRATESHWRVLNRKRARSNSCSDRRTLAVALGGTRRVGTGGKGGRPAGGASAEEIKDEIKNYRKKFKKEKMVAWVGEGTL